MNSYGSTRWLAALALVVSLLLSASPALAQFAPNDDPRRALPLAASESGDIDAAPPTLGLGHFAFYSFVYPGDGSIVSIDVDVTPGDPVSASRAGFNVYGPTSGKVYAEGAQTATHPSHHADFSSTEAGAYLLQIFNYNVTPIHFDVHVTGLPAQPTVVPTQPPPPTTPPAETPPTTPTPVAAGTNTTPERAIALTGLVNGTLAGNTAGSFNFYRFNYPGDNSVVQIDLDVQPSDIVTGQAAGFVVYGPTAGREYARGGYQGTGSPTHTTTFQSSEAGVYLVQVYNYGPGQITYGLERRS